MINSCVRFLEETANKSPEKIAITDKNRSYSFEDLKGNALKIGQSIHHLGPNKPVAIFLPKSCYGVIAFMGTLYTGNFYIPLDVKSPKERLSKIMNDLGPVAIITDSQFEKLIFEIIAGQNIKIVNIESVLSSRETATFNYAEKIAKVIDTDPIYCIYTSGSTGTPKGVLISHRGVVDYIDYAIECYDLNTDSVIGNQAQFHFDISVLDIYVAMKTGATMHIIPEHLFTFPDNLIEYMEEKRIDTIYWVPSVMNHVASTDTLSLLKNKYLKKILFAGEVMPNKTLNYWRRHFPDALFTNLYGPTEITITCTYYIVDREFADSDPLPIGVPCRNSDVFVLDENNRLVETNDTGSIGELCVRGSSLALGYWRDFEKTNASFVQNPLNQNYPERIYRTGDLVKYNNRRELEFHGRKDHQIKHMGYRIEIGEIERAILSIRELENACIFYDAMRKNIVCIYESKKSEVDEHFLRKLLTVSLPKYMIPAVYVRLRKLPINSTGKIDIALIKKNYEDDLTSRQYLKIAEALRR